MDEFPGGYSSFVRNFAFFFPLVHSDDMFSKKQIYILSRWPWIPSPEHTETWEAKFHLIKDHEDITSTKNGGGLGGPTWFTLEIELLDAPRKIMVVNNHPFFLGRLFLGVKLWIGVGHPLDFHGKRVKKSPTTARKVPRLQKEDHNESLVKDHRSLIFKVICLLCTLSHSKSPLNHHSW